MRDDSKSLCFENDCVTCQTVTDDNTTQTVKAITHQASLLSLFDCLMITVS